MPITIRLHRTDAALVALLLAVELPAVLLAAGPPAWRVVPLPAASAALLLWARRRPVTVLAGACAITALAAQPSPPVAAVTAVHAAVTLAVVAAVRGRAVTLAGYAVTVLAVLTVWSQQPGGPLDGPGAAVPALLCAVPVAAGRGVRAYREAGRRAAERVREAEQRTLAETRAARLGERTRIARDLHDILAHHVGAIALRASTGRYAAQHTGRVEDAAAALGEVRGTATQVLEELHGLLSVLRDPDAVDADPPTVEPEEMIAAAAARLVAAGVPVRTAVDPALARLPLTVRTSAARIVQEGLTNVLKHAGTGADAEVSVRVGAADVTVEVADRGGAAAPGVLPASGHGLAGVRERAALLGGSVEAGPADGGWRLRARLPRRDTP